FRGPFDGREAGSAARGFDWSLIRVDLPGESRGRPDSWKLRPQIGLPGKCPVDATGFKPATFYPSIVGVIRPVRADALRTPAVFPKALSFQTGGDRALPQIDRFVVVTGGPGSGKTTLMSALAAEGVRTMPEAGRGIIQDQ